MEAAGEKFLEMHLDNKLDAINPGAWFGKQFATLIGAENALSKNLDTIQERQLQTNKI